MAGARHPPPTARHAPTPMTRHAREKDRETMTRKAPNTTLTPFHAARRHAMRAMRRGDIDNAIRWTWVMREQWRMARTRRDLDDNRLRPKMKPPKAKPAQPAPAASGRPAPPSPLAPGPTRSR